MTTFINTSKTEISAELQARLNAGSHILRDQLERSGVPPEEWGKAIGVFLLGSDADSTEYLLVKKQDFRSFVKTLQKEAKRRLPIYESTLIKCLEDVPIGVMRVLYVSDESCGSMKLFYEEGQKERMDQRIKDRLRATLADAEAYMSDRELKLAEDIHDKIKDLPAKEALQVVMDAELATSAELVELRAKRAALGEAQEDAIRNFVGQLPDFRERWKSVRERVKKVVIPPNTIGANNLETVFMAAVYVFDPITSNIGLSKEEVAFLVGRFAQDDPLLKKLLERMSAGLRGKPFSGILQDFGVSWMRAGFPKLEVGHKLAASLCLTDVPDDIEVQAPWPAWSLIVPPGLFGDGKNEEAYARIWCQGSDPAFFVLSSGEVLGGFGGIGLVKWFEEQGADTDVLVLAQAVASLVKGACLALSNPDDYKRQSIKEKTAAAKKTQRSGEPDFSVSRFMLSAPVQVDVRQHLLELTSGKKSRVGGGTPKVQFFVRGHWRKQAHGPGRALRKTIRIEGFWKGPEEGRVLLRNYKVKDDVQDGDASVQASGKD